MSTTLTPIHLLYVPTLFCNMGCSYCYLGSQTDIKLSSQQHNEILTTLDLALEKITQSQYLAFNLSLHGGEVTTLPAPLLAELFERIRKHYLSHFDALTHFGFKKSNPHIKTNLYNFNRLYDLFLKYEVSISASIDLPLFLHEKYRTTKSGASTLKKTLDNLKLLANYPHKKKISSVIYKEHLDHIPELINDIWYLHNEIGFNMNEFNFMFGFESELNTLKYEHSENINTQAITDTQQVEFYNTLKTEFMGTELEEGFKGNWFDEFKPTYCTNSQNCGEKFFLLQYNGEVHSCVRGQGVPAFQYGNILNESFETIVKRATHKIKVIHQKQELHSDCQSCDYLHLCNTGCAFVKDQQKSGKSYTCLLQKEIYKDNPISYPPLSEESRKRYLTKYIDKIHPLLAKTQERKPEKFMLSNDFMEPKNEFLEIIHNDQTLKLLYGENQILLNLNGQILSLESPLTESTRNIFHLNLNSKIEVLISEEYFLANAEELIRNTLYIQMLRDTPVIYGDEKRAKQEHLFTHQVFHNLLEKTIFEEKNYYRFDLKPLLALHQNFYLEGVMNNVFITTDSMRNYHYQKQKANAFYHIQAINLPFSHFEFIWEKTDS